MYSLTVSKIIRGTVIDHIPAGRGIDVLKVLKITGREGYRIAVLMNVESKKLGRKDIVKIENRFLEPNEVNIISLIAPSATINIIEDYEIKKKFRVEVPPEIKGVLKCPNPTCITNQSREPITSHFKKISSKPLRLQCTYCGTIIEENEIPRYLGV
ncbi:MAG: aspartate carbamoyltransferase regulatory subunit [Sulfolobales archaeon]|jgi:aspartate carbamoyltransferase regulatory subunit